MSANPNCNWCQGTGKSNEYGEYDWLPCLCVCAPTEPSELDVLRARLATAERERDVALAERGAAEEALAAAEDTIGAWVATREERDRRSTDALGERDHYLAECMAERDAARARVEALRKALEHAMSLTVSGCSRDAIEYSIRATLAADHAASIAEKRGR